MSGVTNSHSPNAFLLSATLHGLVAALLLFFAYVAKDHTVEAPKIFELVAGPGDNYAATEAPVVGVPNGIKVDIPQPPVVTPAPDPTPIAPTPPQPVPQTPIAPIPKPAKPVPPKPTPDLAKMVTRIADKRATKIEKKFLKEKQEAEARAAKEAALSAKRVTKIDVEGIAAGVLDGSTNNKTGGAGSKALTREEMDLSDAYIALLMQRLKEAHRKPEGLSDLLQTKVEFRLNPNGTISGVNIVKSSGNAEYDASVLAAFRNIRLPSPLKLKIYIYSITFKMKEDE